jgi:SSS family solute:Na+ symporter
MTTVDAVILVLYMCAMLGVGFWFLRRNADNDDYYVGGRGMGSTHVGLSVVATDVGGGFSIGLGGLGFAMGLSGSWMLFTGFLGAWMAAALLIPTIFRMGRRFGLLTYPQVFGSVYSPRVAMVAAIISAIGYVGFTSSQVLAGAKLASATIQGLDLQAALLVMGVLAVVYTSMGGMKAVIYTDTVQWILLLVGLIFVGLPIAYHELGGYTAIRATVPDEMLSLGNVGVVQILNWTFAILPIWFVGMTLYQRIYACRDERSARRAWFLAGVLEWPTMAFLGVALGLLGRVAWQQGHFAAVGFGPGSEMDPEMGLPLLLSQLLPTGMMGLMMAAYFSAILSTADSCLMAASGNVTTDIVPARRGTSQRGHLLRSQGFTLGLGVIALVLASSMTSVLDLMLYSYGFMVSGLLVPTIALLALARPSSRAALASMLGGGGVTITLGALGVALPAGLDANIFGISTALVVFLVVQANDGGFARKRPVEPLAEDLEESRV